MQSILLLVKSQMPLWHKNKRRNQRKGNWWMVVRTGSSSGSRISQMGAPTRRWGRWPIIWPFSEPAWKGKKIGRDGGSKPPFVDHQEGQHARTFQHEIFAKNSKPSSDRMLYLFIFVNEMLHHRANRQGFPTCFQRYAVKGCYIFYSGN